MRALLILLGLIFALQAAPAARAQVTLDVAKITCDQFTGYKITNPQNIAMWLSGYYNGKRGNTILDAQGLTVVVATVSLFHEIHAATRTRFAEYLEVLLACDEATRARRRSQDGPQVGVDIAAELPIAPDLVLRSDSLPAEAIAQAIVTRWHERHGR